MKLTTHSITYEDAVGIDLKNNGSDIPDLGMSATYTQGAQAAEMQISIVCSNVPIGSAVQFCCGKPGPNPIIYLPITTVTNNNVTISIRTYVPANFTSDIFAFYWSNGHAPLPGFNIKLEALYIVDKKGED